MRTRLSIRIIAIVLALWQLQGSNVLAQKYYMNFAFNNNNPDADNSDAGQANPPDLPAHPTSSLELDPNDNNENDNPDSPDSPKKSSKENSDAGSGNADGDGKAGSEATGGATGDTGTDTGNESGATTKGVDDDNDDSDSLDPLHSQLKRSNEGPDGGHSHHSSYEISIDDSFGGRYVRSIYESSESHGHSGSNPASNSRDGGNKKSEDSSQSKQKPAPRTFGTDDYEEFNGD